MKELSDGSIPFLRAICAIHIGVGALMSESKAKAVEEGVARVHGDSAILGCV